MSFTEEQRPMGAVATRTACACGCEADDAFFCHGFMCKPRTPRRGRKPSNRAAKEEGIVPDLEEDDTSAEENLQSSKEVQQQRMIHRLPIFDPAVLVEFFSLQLHPQLEAIEENDSSRAEVRVVEHDQMASMGRLDYCLDLEKLEPDMETLLGVGCDGYAKKDEYRVWASADGPGETTRRMLLRLDYDAVIDAWSSSTIGCSPWTDGERPQFEDTWPDISAVRHQVKGRGDHEAAGGVYRLDRGVVGVEGREARVWRYREKRRRRLFSKKIRYEVRKRNAEKRPRMKGRFVRVHAEVAAPPD